MANPFYAYCSIVDSSSAKLVTTRKIDVKEPPLLLIEEDEEEPSTSDHKRELRSSAIIFSSVQSQSKTPKVQPTRLLSYLNRKSFLVFLSIRI